jgi:hypothetical protein
LVLAGLTAPAYQCQPEAASRQADGPLDLGLERSFVHIELKWFGEQMLPVLLAPVPLVTGAGKPMDERAMLRQWQSAVRILMRGVHRSDDNAYPVLDPKEFMPLYAPFYAEFACLMEQTQQPLFAVEGWRIVWDIQLRSCSPQHATVTREMSLANNHFAAIGPLLKRPLTQADAYRNRFLAMSLFAVFFHKVQVLRRLMKNRQNGERPTQAAPSAIKLLALTAAGRAHR